MFDSSTFIAPIVFLHIPKTAGQTIHNELRRAVGGNNVSPIRVHSQAPQPKDQFPSGYRLYSGHLDWSALENFAQPRFSFSILRDPRERIASFYFYLLKEAKALSDTARQAPENIGKNAILNQSADDYFFGGSDPWRAFILDHYDNFYCRYFASQKVRAGTRFGDQPNRRKLRMALKNVEKIDWIYAIENLGALESDLNELYGFDLDFTARRTNIGDQPIEDLRWPRLLETLEHDASRAKLEAFVALDIALMERLEL